MDHSHMSGGLLRWWLASLSELRSYTKLFDQAISLDGHFQLDVDPSVSMANILKQFIIILHFLDAKIHLVHGDKNWR
jgi:hypothetical protein